MSSQWITSWVLWLGHHKRSIAFFIASIGVVLAVSLFWVVGSFEFLFMGESGLVLLSMLLMSLLAIKLLDSFKTAILLLFVMLFLYVLSSSILLLLGFTYDKFSVLARVVVVTIMMSHLIHFLAALLREMARGIHQYDAIVDALSITHQPILLSSLTTIFGFVVVSIFNDSFSIMAYQVIIGVVLSYVSLLVVVPTILLYWLLEFRVGNYADRHGLSSVLKLFKNRPTFAFLSRLLLVSMLVFMLVKLWLVVDFVNALLGMLLISLLLLLVVWRRLWITLSAMLIALFAVLFAVIVLSWLGIVEQVSPLVLLVPIGIVLDDVVHFFSRYIRASKQLSGGYETSVSFALSSVGRPIWLTSQLLIAGLLVLIFSSSSLVVDASLVTIFSLSVVSFIILWVLPAFISNKNNSKL